MAAVIELANPVYSNGVQPVNPAVLVDGSGAGGGAGVKAGALGTGTYSVIDPAHAALRTSVLPMDVTGGGSYRAAWKSSSTGITGLSATNPIVSVRFASTTLNALITRIAISPVITTVAGTPGILDFGWWFARAFTAADTGGVALTLTTNNAKKRTSYATTAMTIQYSQTATLTAGTRTLDANPIAVASTWLTTSLLGEPVMTFGDPPEPFGPEQEGILLSGPNKEGLILTQMAATPASAVYQLYVEIDWKEVPLAAY